MTASVYWVEADVLAETREAALDAGVALSENLLGGVFVNQSPPSPTSTAATGARPGGDASCTDGAYVGVAVPGGAVTAPRVEAPHSTTVPVRRAARGAARRSPR